MTDMNYNGQALQDKFVLKILKNKKNGFFLEIGSRDPKEINNTYILEKNFDWKGIMVEYDLKWLDLYKKERKNSFHIMEDATKINYKKFFVDNNIPLNLDYLQIDLEANNGSTINTLKKLDNEILEEYKFATVTFEHDVYHTNNFNTRKISRDIFKKHGYVCVFKDVDLFEDWYVHPELVDMDYVNNLMKINVNNYETVNGFYNYRNYKGRPNTNKVIHFKNIIYN